MLSRYDYFAQDPNFPAVLIIGELIEEEKKEREKYRRIYIDKFKESLKGHLDNIKIVKVDDEGNSVDDDGNMIPTEA